MPKSGSLVTPGKPKRKRITEIFPMTGVAASKSVSPQEGPSSTELLEPNLSRILRLLARFEISEEEWRACPEITDLARRCIGGQRRVISVLRWSDDPEVKKLMKVIHTMGDEDRVSCPLEIPCLAAGVSPHHILAMIMTGARDASKAESAMIAIMENPEQLRAAAHFGKTDVNAFRDREMFMKITKTLPTPQGGGINIFVGEGGGDDGPDVDPEDSDLPSDVFAYNSKTIDGWGDNRRRLMDADKRK